ncbi:K(+)/H(+) antiporter YhaU [compost metagenome]
MANLGKAGGLLAILQPFAAMYVLMLAILGPLLTKESKWIFKIVDKVFKFEKRHAERSSKKAVVAGEHE